MKHITLPQPPDANRYRADPFEFMVAASEWMRQAKIRIEDASRLNDSPLGQQFLSTNFTTNTVVSESTTGTDLSNFVASLVQAMTDRGIVSPTVRRGDG